MNNDYLIKQIKNKDKTGFKNCYEFFFKDLVIYANKYLYDYSVGEDIVQEVFVYLWQHSDSIEIEVSLKSYLYTMVKNRSLNHLKSIKISDRENFLEFSNSMIIDIEKPLSSIKSENKMYLKILDIINNMPSKMQEISRLKFVENYKYSEIAEELGISINTVKTQLKRAKIKINESLILPLILLLNCY